MLASGTPYEAEISKPDAHTPSKPARLINLVIPSWAPTIRTNLFSKIAFRFFEFSLFLNQLI